MLENAEKRFIALSDTDYDLGHARSGEVGDGMMERLRGLKKERDNKLEAFVSSVIALSKEDLLVEFCQRRLRGDKPERLFRVWELLTVNALHVVLITNPHFRGDYLKVLDVVAEQAAQGSDGEPF